MWYSNRKITENWGEWLRIVGNFWEYILSISENMFVMLSEAKHLKSLQPLPSLREVPWTYCPPFCKGGGSQSRRILSSHHHLCSTFKGSCRRLRVLHLISPCPSDFPLAQGGLFAGFYVILNGSEIFFWVLSFWLFSIWFFYMKLYNIDRFIFTCLIYVTSKLLQWWISEII